MASASIRKAFSGRYQVHWRLNDGSRGGRTFDRHADAVEFKNRLLANEADASWIDPRRGRVAFGEWLDQWWTVWSSRRLSPKTLQCAEGRLRRYLRPAFGHKRLGQITPSVVQRWQNELEATKSHDVVMACRWLLNSVMQAAVNERLIADNPVRSVPAPKRPVDPEVIFSGAKTRTFTAEEFGELLVGAPRYQRDHLLILVGTGLRAGEFCGMRARRVKLDRQRLEVLDTRYEAGKTFGTGYKDRPKSPAGIRTVPLAPLVAEAVARQLPPADDPDALAFTGPGGGRWVAVGERRTALSVSNLRRSYKLAVARARKRGRLGHLHPKGPHDLRHTFATWLEDAGIPARVIDELMGHGSGRASRLGEQRGSQIGTVYRHTTAAMEARVRATINERLALAVKVADEVPMEADKPSQREALLAAHEEGP
jgi:integrase